jgi:SM-20-related protein
MVKCGAMLAETVAKPAPEPDRFLDLDALRTTPLATEPYPHLIVPNFVRRDAFERLNQEFPSIEGPGSYPPESLRMAPLFAEFIAALESDELRGAFAAKFGLDLAGRPAMVTVRGRIRQANGDIHTDTASKLITVLIYLNRDWEQPGGRLRILRSMNMDDLVTEIPPVGGTMLAFRVSDHSWHGHLPSEGVRRAIQLNWVTDEGVRRRELRRHQISAGVKRLKKIFG